MKLEGTFRRFTDKVTPEESFDRWREMRETLLRGKVVWLLMIAYGVLLAATLVIIFFQGFHYRGFRLELSFLHWLGGATIGEIGGLSALVYDQLFRR